VASEWIQAHEESSPRESCVERPTLCGWQSLPIRIPGLPTSVTTDPFSPLALRREDLPSGSCGCRQKRPLLLTSLIVADFLPLFAKFSGKWFTLLWPLRRKKCSQPLRWPCGHSDAVPGQGREYFRADPSLKSFLVTLKDTQVFPRGNVH
jgi:hypothetical protein